MNAPPFLLGAGWKMNKTIRQAEAYVRTLLELLDGIEAQDRIELFIVPPFTAISAVKRACEGRFWVGAQNMHWAPDGAYTGEISAPMLREAGADLVELGHAERRRHFNETDEDLCRKVQAALQYGLRPLLCVGDDIEARENGGAERAVARQLEVALGTAPARCADRLIIAYEPVWAIGESGRPAHAHEVRRMREHIRGVLSAIFGPAARAVPVLYGGSVTCANAAQLLEEGEADGLFAGRAAWTAEGFAELIRIAAGAGRPAVTPR